MRTYVQNIPTENHIFNMVIKTFSNKILFLLLLVDLELKRKKLCF